MTKTDIIPIYIGFDHRERAATNVLIDSLYQKSSVPLSIIPLVTDQLKKSGLYTRVRDPKQSTDFSFTRFLVPYLQNYKGWAMFMDCDMLCREDINNLWIQRNDKYSLMCVKHKHIPKSNTKFLGEIQTKYPKKNWSSLMLINCSKCETLTLDKVNNASGLELHRFNWLENDKLIGEIKGNWNFLVDENEIDKSEITESNPPLLHWTLGGPWFKAQREIKNNFNEEWFECRKRITSYWD